MNNVIALQHYNENSTVSGILSPAKRAELAFEPTLSADFAVRYVDGPEFDRLAARYDDVVSEQTSRFVESRWGASRTERIVVERGGEEIAVAALVVFSIPGTGRGLAIAKWGPLWRQKGQTLDVTRLRNALQALRLEYVDRRGLFLSVQPHADPEFSDASVEALKGLGFTEGSSLPYPDRYLVDVSVTPEELKSSLDQKWRYNLKKSLKNDLEIKMVEAGAGYAEFMQLYEQMLDRKQFQDSSAIATLADLVHAEEPEHRPVFVMVYADGRPTAGAVLGIAGDRAVYLYGATDERALRLKAGYAMHGWIADWLCGLPGARWYDLGGTDGDQGLHQFKKGFCGKLGRIVTTPPNYRRSRTAVDDILVRTIYMAHDLKAATSRTLHRAKSLLAA
ncbi:MAG: peptidoglycan bridge formation glycyltransferase FemA/FemB family protein [Alphaproteobacteria bacterium]|nr:peptidoglycan bridge formation glycyltransferase FemA/FemB family protein [Alphaproteobacteria bacterium]